MEYTGSTTGGTSGSISMTSGKSTGGKGGTITLSVGDGDTGVGGDVNINAGKTSASNTQGGAFFASIFLYFLFSTIDRRNKRRVCHGW